MIRPSASLMASRTGVRASLQMQCPLKRSFLHPKHDMHPVYLSSLNRLNLSTSAPEETAPLEASEISVSVFHPVLGPGIR